MTGSCAKNPKKKGPVFTATETNITIDGNKVFVPVILGYNGREVKTMLIFDTGASAMVLHENIADTLGIADYTESKAFGVGGIEIDTKRMRLDYVIVGPHRKADLLTHIVAYQGAPMANYNGILGMNFLKGLEYFIDFDKHIIKWQH